MNMIFRKGNARVEWRSCVKAGLHTRLTRLFLVQAKGIRRRVETGADSVLGLLEDTLALAGGVIRSATNGVTDPAFVNTSRHISIGGHVLLASALLVLRLECAGSTVSSAGDGLLGLIKSRLLRVRSDLLLDLLCRQRCS